MRARRTVSEGCTRGVLALALLSTAAPLHGQNDAADLDRLLAGTQVVVVPFRNIAGGPDTNWIGEGIAEAVAVGQGMMTNGAWASDDPEHQATYGLMADYALGMAMDSVEVELEADRED